MFINKIKLNNFRKYKETAFSFHQNFNLLIGNNAAGKTSVLDAIALLLNTYFQGSGITTGGSVLKKTDARYIATVKAEQTFFESQKEVWIMASAFWDGLEIEWQRDLGDRGAKAKDLIALGSRKRLAISTGESPDLPLLVYYGAGRLWDIHRDIKTEKPGSQLDAYRFCLDPKSDPYTFQKIFKKLTLSSLQRNREVPALSTIESAIISCIPGAKRFFHDVDEDQILIELEKEGLVRFADLSDGYRNMVAMVADIAQRCTQLNPQFGHDSTRKTKGIVLIDEIDLHLHPKWQRRVVPDLRATFPQLQFITTSHSPFIIQSMNPGEIIDLDTNADLGYENHLHVGSAAPAPTNAFSDKPIEDIVEDVMDVPLPQRSHRHQQMYDVAKKYYLLLEQGKNADPTRKEQLKIELDTLSAPFSDEIAYHAFLEMERIAAGMGKSDKGKNK